MSDQTPYELDEISLVDIFNKLWSRRGLLVIIPFLSLALGGIHILQTKVKVSTPTVYYVQLQGIKNAEYPNGAKFSPTDLLLPEVLEQIAQEFNIAMTPRFRNAISVEYGSPLLLGVHKKYQLMLTDAEGSRTNLRRTTTAEIEKINQDYENEVLEISRSGIKVTVNHGLLGLQPNEGVELAAAIPRIWNQVIADKYSVMTDNRLSGAIIDKDINNLTDSTDILAARDTLKQIIKGLKIISNDNRLQYLRSSSGFNSEYLLNLINSFENRYFKFLVDDVYKKSDMAAKAYLIDTKLKIEELDLSIEAINRNISDIRNFSTNNYGDQGVSDPENSVQFSDNTITQIVNLSNKASLTEYLKEILIERKNLLQRRAVLNTEITRAESPTIVFDVEKLHKNAVADYNYIQNEYLLLLKKIQIISQEKYGDFYRPLGLRGGSQSTITNKSKLILALSFLIGLFIAVMVALVLPGKNKSKIPSNDA